MPTTQKTNWKRITPNLTWPTANAPLAEPTEAQADEAAREGCTRCKCLLMSDAKFYDEDDRPLCGDCYQELYAERDRADEKWQRADLEYDRRRGT
jgi:formylmethanofuran dehydrogenase subunit E